MDKPSHHLLRIKCLQRPWLPSQLYHPRALGISSSGFSHGRKILTLMFTLHTSRKEAILPLQLYLIMTQCLLYKIVEVKCAVTRTMFFQKIA